MSDLNFIEVAKTAARKAGDVHQKYFQTDLKVRHKETSFDQVTQADVESEQVIVETIRASFGDHNFLGEEDSYEQTDSDYTWIIDPLDGTNNFVTGLPIFASSVALAHKGEVIAGAIYDVSRDEMFWTAKGRGAFLNDQKISVNQNEILAQSVLITGFYYDRGQDMEDTLNNIRSFFQNDITGIRRLGAAALDMCYVACGRVAGFWEFKLHPWDYAAGYLLVEEAGGMITNKAGAKIDVMDASYVVASNGKIHGEMLRVLN